MHTPLSLFMAICKKIRKGKKRERERERERSEKKEVNEEEKGPLG